MRKIVLSVVLAGALPVAAAAQVCVGTPSYAAGRMRAGVDIGRTEGGSTHYGAELAAGHASGGFAQASLSTAHYDGFREHSSALGLGAGYAVDMNPRKTAQFCPLIGYTYTRGPDGGNFTMRTHTLSVGGGIGGVMPINPGAAALPFLSAEVVRSRTNLDGPSHTFSVSNYVLWTVGLGLVLDETFTIRPAFSRPANVRDPRNTYSLGLTVNFGRPATGRR